MKPLRLLVVASLVVVSACSGGPTIDEYAEELESLVATMNARIDQLDAEVEREPGLEAVRTYAQQRVAARSAFLASLRDLDPPDEIADLHGVALGIIERLTAAESALADRVMTMDSIAGIDSIWDTPEGIAARTADEKAIELCLAAQSEFDDTAERSEFKDVPWIPSAMKAVVVVAFGCLAAER
jgi:outer membrane murein-binding lipoprotein Lpp